MKKIISTLMLASFCILYTGCPGSSSSSSSSTSSGGGSGGGGGGGSGGGTSGQTIAEITQAGYYCSEESGLGSALGSNGMVHQLVLESNGDFLWSVTITDGTTGCSNSVDSNGTEIATYALSGTYTVNGGVSASGTTATEVAFTISSAYITLSSTSGSAFATWLESCGVSFSSGTTSAQAVTGAVCPTASGFSAVNLPTAGAVVYNLGDNTGSVLEIGPRADMWRPGASSYPTSLTESYGQ